MARRKTIEREVAFFLVGGKVGTIRFLAPDEITKRRKLTPKVKRELAYYVDIESFVAGRKPVEIIGPILMTFSADGEEILSPPEYATA